MPQVLSADWPVLKRYSGSYVRRVAMPLGGIGTGTVSLGGRGDLRDWEVANRPAKGFSPEHCFLALRTQTQSGEVFARLLEGPIAPEDYEGGFGCPIPNAGFPRFSDAEFQAAYPLAQIELRDPQCPLQVRMKAFNPLVPGDANASGHPAAVLRIVLSNPTDEIVQASIAFTLKNWLGADGTDSEKSRNHNEARQSQEVRGVLCTSDLSPTSPLFGTLALGVVDEEDVSQRLSWAPLSWGDTRLDFWDDFSLDGRLEEREQGDEDKPVASLCARVEVAPGESREVSFVLAWHFPNRQTWTPQQNESCCESPSTCGPGDDSSGDTIGNFYTSQSADAWEALQKFVVDLPDMEARTVEFARALYDSDLPEVVREAAGFNLSTLRSQTCFRTPDGHFWGWEGCGDKGGCCHGTCTHVWNYEFATAHLFGDLSRSMREVEFVHNTDERGFMSFRASLPLGRAQADTDGMAREVAAADGQMGCIVKLWRDWKGYGDDAWLRELWPAAKRALEFCWIEGGWDADRDGVMEGCQHNTMDVEYFGPNPQMQGWYLAALRAGEEISKYLEQDDFASECRRLYTSGRAWMDEQGWNGEYYEHHIRPPHEAANIAPGLMLGSGAKNLHEPELQLGAGCLIDQLVGVLAARLCGLGEIVDADHERETLRSILKHNGRASLRGHFNHLRTFALGEEEALLMASYPRGNRPTRPFPYYNEVMTGFEHTVAAHLFALGENEAGEKVTRDIRARYDGLKRNPFDEAECGHHYARALASWNSLLALSGFEWDARSGTLGLRAAQSPCTWFWSNGSAWGTVRQTPREEHIEVELQVLGGELEVRRLLLHGVGEVELSPREKTARGGTLQARVARR